MENLFDYATKELSQDAFLRWFIKSNIDESGQKLLSAFTGIDYKQIEIIETWAQVHDIDIVVDFKVNGEDCILIIEDKVNTGHHDNQLERYMNMVQGWNKREKGHENRKSYFIFYKPRILPQKEKEDIEKYKWVVFDLPKISPFFEKYINSDNLIIKQYSKHVRDLTEDSTNDKIPNKHRILAWKSFFERTVKPYFNDTDLDVNVDETFYGYSYLNFRPKKYDKEKTPYLEIRSRDCLNGVIGRILLYGVEITDEEKEQYKKRIEDFGKLFNKENNKQQIGCTNKLSYKDQEEFIETVTAIAEEYLNIITK